MEEAIKPSDNTNRKPFWKDPSNLFVIKILTVYIGWKLAYALLHSGNGFLQAEWSSFIDWTGSVYAVITGWILNGLGEKNIHKGINIILIENPRIIMVEEHCLAMPAMVLFTFSILFFSGSWRNKLWFIPLGILVVMAINVVRLVAVCLTFKYMSVKTFHLYHSFIYVAITYAIILLMIYWWMKKFSGVPVRAVRKP